MEVTRPFTLLSKSNKTALGIFSLLFFLIVIAPQKYLQAHHGLEEYLALHSILEMFSITVSVMTFAIGWENRNAEENRNTIFIALTFLAVAFIDMAHLLSFPGMPVLVTPSSANKSIFLWLSARMTIALSMLCLASSKITYFHFNKEKYLFFVLTIIFVSIIYYIAFFHLNLIPDSFIEGKGLTPFKIYVETVIVVILLLATFNLYKHGKNLTQSFDVNNIFMAMIIMMMSETFFMLFTTHADLYNLLGHVFKACSYYYFYRALFKEKILKPYAELDQKNHELLIANQAKTQFLANVSHEIRTPINAIVNLTELLEQSKNTSEQDEYFPLLKQSNEQLLKLVDNVLTLSLIDSGVIEENLSAFDLRLELKQLIDSLSIRAEQKDVKIIININSDVPRIIQSDLNKLNLIIHNLVENAVKFTDQGLINVDVSNSLIEDQSVILLFQIKDQGIGIPEDKIPLLFKIFSQVDSSNTRKYGGPGLGLAISKRLVEFMGGKIWITSKPQQGSNFSFTLKAKIAF